MNEGFVRGEWVKVKEVGMSGKRDGEIEWEVKGTLGESWEVEAWDMTSHTVNIYWFLTTRFTDFLLPSFSLSHIGLTNITFHCRSLYLLTHLTFSFTYIILHTQHRFHHSLPPVHLTFLVSPLHHHVTTTTLPNQHEKHTYTFTDNPTSTHRLIFFSATCIL